IRDNNSGLPEGTKIDVGDNGDTTITYPDKSVDTISGDKLVEEKTSAENLDPTVPDKTKVDDPTELVLKDSLKELDVLKLSLKDELVLKDSLNELDVLKLSLKDELVLKDSLKELDVLRLSL
ncbi:hypothetical protein OZJ21_09745, partial [Ligilactobacillus sp. UO.C109]|nr:hypothetical protein [Ligilactobacillus sp. UO.C109]